MKKRMLSFLMVLLLILNTLPSALAAEAREAANTLYALGLFQGVGTAADGTPDFALDRVPTRSEAVVMLVRLLGKESAAKTGIWDVPFDDVDSWAMPYVGYAYSNGLTSGTGPGTFGGGANISAAQYITLVLRALGYSDGTDFTWYESWKLSDELGLTAGEYSGAASFDRGDVAAISLSALGAAKKNSDNTLLKTLYQDGAVTDGQIAAAGLYADLTPGTVMPSRQTLTSEEIYQTCAPAVFCITTYDMNGDEYAQGSGFFIDAAGTAVTNCHVLENAFSAEIETTDGKNYTDITVLAYDFDQDVAVLKVNGGAGFSFLKLGDSSALAGGETVYAIGNPYGLKSSISSGLVSNPQREDFSGMIQISVPISSGSSGGALINQYGDVIGITTAGYLYGQNLNFAIPVATATTLARGSGVSLSEVSRQQDLHEYAQLPEAFSDNYNEIEPNNNVSQAYFIENGASVWGTMDDEYFDTVLVRCNTTGTIMVYLFSDSADYLVKDLVLGLRTLDSQTLAYGDYYTADDGSVMIYFQYDVTAPGVFQLSLLSNSLYNVLSSYSVDYALYYKFVPDGAQ